LLSQLETGKIAASDIPHCGRLSPGARFVRNATLQRRFQGETDYRRFDFFDLFLSLAPTVFLRAAPARARDDLVFVRDAAGAPPRREDFCDRRCGCFFSASALSIGFAISPAFFRSFFSTGASMSGARRSTCLTASAAAAAITFFANGEGAIAFSAAVTAARTAVATIPFFFAMMLRSRWFPVP
jgi:hypothetical protein